MEFNTNKAIEFLLARGNLPILYWLKKDILEVPVEREYKNLKKFASRIRILKKQQPDGSWSRKKYEGPPRWEKSYYIVETLRNTFKLYNYGCVIKDDSIQRAVNFLYSTQSKEGDFRGAYLNEYAPTYHALTLEILCFLGLDKDKRTQKGFQWIIDNTQHDGGWVIPYRTIDKADLKTRLNFEAQAKLKPVMPDKTQPFSHLVTGMILRAFAASPTWRTSKEAKKAGELLVSRFFKPDKYEDRRLPFFWEEITYPFWGTDLLSSLDSLSKIGFDTNHEKIQQALRWLRKRQDEEGYWKAKTAKPSLENHLWVTLAVLRVLKRFGYLDL
ncbi:MAG: prenyltransferase/squalene oxidase repeat-containing protein [Candidatus Aminicenantes bacterium]